MSSEKFERCKVEQLHQLRIYTPTLRVSEDTTPLEKPLKQPGSKLRRLTHARHDQTHYHYYPALIDPDGSPWVLGNRYLLSKVTRYIPAKRRTLESVAYDLCHFRTWCLEESVDYLVSRGRFRVRPTYRYSFLLHDDVRSMTIKASTAKRRMGAVVNFYRWLIEDGFEFEEPLWQSAALSVSYSDKYGFARFKDVETTDLSKSFRVTKQADDYSDYIYDGRKLRPLSKAQQRALITTLKKIGNTEMLLSFQLALATGARIQTVFTLRRQQFIAKYKATSSTIRIKIGHGTLVDNKQGKQMVLQVPSTLYFSMQVYLASERAEKRRSLSRHKYSDENHEYAFLTRSGRAFYLHSEDQNTGLYRSPANGNSVRKFIEQAVKPHLQAEGDLFNFSFHDLRATFCMNLLEAIAEDSNKVEPSLSAEVPLFKKLMYVSSRMGHSDISTTERYLSYGEKRGIALRLQDEYESRLESLL